MLTYYFILVIVQLTLGFYLVQHVVGPSRVTATNTTLIDHIISGSQIPMLRSIQVCSFSDHKVEIVNFI